MVIVALAVELEVLDSVVAIFVVVASEVVGFVWVVVDLVVIGCTEVVDSVVVVVVVVGRYQGACR